MTTTEEIGPAVAALVRKQIDGSRHDDAHKKRLLACLPRLAGAIESSCPAVMMTTRSGVAVAYGPDDIGRSGIVIAAATPRNGIVLHCSDWPHINETAAARFSRADIAAQVANAIESAHDQPISDNEASNVLVGLYLLLGPAGRDAYARDAIQIAGTGGLPLIVLLTDHRDGKALSLVATVGIPPPLQEQIAAIEATDATLN
jgi:hypothetical protein